MRGIEPILENCRIKVQILTRLNRQLSSTRRREKDSNKDRNLHVRSVRCLAANFLSRTPKAFKSLVKWTIAT
jgi:hypothetical protein